MNALVKFCELTLSLFILPRGRLDGSHLALDLLQFLLRF
jgi:hypothetical protein